MSSSNSMLLKTAVVYIVFAMCLMDACAEEFGISRRTPAYVQQPVPHQVLPYVVRIIAFDSSGQSFGTGSYIGTYGKYGIVLTNQHVVCETGNGRLVHVHFPSGFSSFGAIVQTDRLWDLAIIAISKPPDSIPTLPIARSPSKPGDPLWIAGFGSGLYRMAEGRCVRYLAPEHPKNGDTPLYEIIEVSVSARKGDSGGPILNQRGELAGVLFGSDMVQHTAGSYSNRVNRFLMETRGRMERLPGSPEAYFAEVEANGPVFSLQESRYAVPQAGSGSSSRQYVPPTPIPEFHSGF